MSKKEISPSLSRLEVRAKDLNCLKESIVTKEVELYSYNSRIESLNFELDELINDRKHICSRVSCLIRDAIKEGYSITRVRNFIKFDLKLKWIIPYLDSDIQDMFMD